MTTIISSADINSFNEPLLTTFQNQASYRLYQIASFATEPICLAHECYVRSKVENLAKRLGLLSCAFFFAILAAGTSLPGIALRWAASKIQTKPFIHISNQASYLDPPKKFSLLSWNVCCVGGGYTISDGGVLPWRSRIENIGKEILKKNADITCLYETFDTQSAFYLAQKFKDAGYCDIFFNMGSKGVGVSSGILVASKYRIKNPNFTRFSKDLLVGRTKNAAKGVFSFDLSCNDKPFATIFATHLQHSEIPQIPTPDERSAREKQMGIISEKIQKIANKCVLLTGDLNLDRDEANNSNWLKDFSEDDSIKEIKTWGGDEFCAKLMKKEVSSPLNLDYTLLKKDSAESLTTTAVETGFESDKYKKEALSDHLGLYSEITLKT